MKNGKEKLFVVAEYVKRIKNKGKLRKPKQYTN